MHLVLELLKDIRMVEVGVCEKTVESPDDVEEMLRRCGRDRHSWTEIVRVLDDGGRIIESVNHVVNRWTILSAFVSSADEYEVLICCHLWACLACADSEQLYDQQIQLQDELSNMLILPNAFIDWIRKFADFLNVSWVRSWHRKSVNHIEMYSLISSWRYSCVAKGPFIFEMSS